MILACQNINKAFGTNVILKDASFHIEEKEKAAIVGINGAGKSTLLKIIMKQIPADSGEVILAKDRTIGYLAQHEAVSSGNTIYEELLEVKQRALTPQDGMIHDSLSLVLNALNQDENLSAEEAEELLREELQKELKDITVY